MRGHWKIAIDETEATEPGIGGTAISRTPPETGGANEIENTIVETVTARKNCESAFVG